MQNLSIQEYKNFPLRTIQQQQKKQSGDILPISLCQRMMSKEVSVNRKYLKTKQQLTMSERKL